MELTPRLIYRHVAFANRDALLDHIAADLHEFGYVKASYARAIKEREVAFPTGLPVPGGVAIPHTDASHVLKDGLVVATLAEPLLFGEMGGAVDDTVPVSLVIGLVLSDGEKHLQFLSSTIQAIQDPEFVAAVTAATSDDEIRAAVTTKLGL